MHKQSMSLCLFRGIFYFFISIWWCPGCESCIWLIYLFERWTIVNGFVFVFSKFCFPQFIDNLKKYLVFCVLNVYTETLLNSPIHFWKCLYRLNKNSVQMIIKCINYDYCTFIFHAYKPFISSCLIQLVRTSSTIITSQPERQNPCFIPVRNVLGRKQLVFL